MLFGFAADDVEPCFDFNRTLSRLRASRIGSGLVDLHILNCIEKRCIGILGCAEPTLLEVNRLALSLEAKEGCDENYERRKRVTDHGVGGECPGIISPPSHPVNQSHPCSRDPFTF